MTSAVTEMGQGLTGSKLGRYPSNIEHIRIPFLGDLTRVNFKFRMIAKGFPECISLVVKCVKLFLPNDFCQKLIKMLICVIEFCHNYCFWVLSQLSFCVLSQFEFLCCITICVFGFCHNLCFLSCQIKSKI